MERILELSDEEATIDTCRSLVVCGFVVKNGLDGFSTRIWRDLLSECRQCWVRALGTKTDTLQRSR